MRIGALDVDAALAALQVAIQTEIDGHNFYQQFAERTEDPNARAMFERLARDEIIHHGIQNKERDIVVVLSTWRSIPNLNSGGQSCYSLEIRFD